MVEKQRKTQKPFIPNDIGLVGGELVSPTATLRDEPDNSEAFKRGWLNAISSAFRKREEVGDEQLNINLQELVKRAMEHGVSKEDINAHFRELGILVEEGRNPDENRVDAAKPEVKEKKSSPFDFDYTAIADQIPLDENNPRASGMFFPPVVTNVYGENDEPTLAGKVALSAYDALVKRPDAKDYAQGEIPQLLEVSDDMIDEFSDQVTQVRPDLGPHMTRPSGKDGFHFNGEKRSSKSFLFYFNKSKANYERDEMEVRAYITLNPTERRNVHKHFVELSLLLYDAGIDFTAKAASIFGVTQRTDNIVLYISASDQNRANGLIKDFLTTKAIGQGHMLAGIHSQQEGLSWALEPNDEQNEFWKKMSGSSKSTSFNTYVAARAMPHYLRRLADAHRKLGNDDEAKIFNDEADRVEGLL